MKQRYSISFDDIQGRQVDVAIYGRDWTGGVTELTGGASPLTLDEDDAEGIDTPCRAWTGSLTVMTEDGVDYSGLYAADVTDVRVEVRREGLLVWQGYVSPEVMRQSWVAGEELTVSVQSPLAALSGLTLDASAGFGFPTLGGLLAEALALTGDWDTVTFPADLSVPGRTGLDTWLDLTVSRMAFFTREYDESEWDEGDVARIVYQGATGREVVEAVARLTGWTARERGRTLWLTAESVSAYITVAVGELGTAGRATTVVAAPTVVLDGLRPAGTDHTVSTLRGYRRVRVRFTPDVVDDLLADVLDQHNWVPTGEVAYEEDYECLRDVTIPGQPQPIQVDAGWYVAYLPNGVFVERDRMPALKYRFARYARGSVDGNAVTWLYRAEWHDDGTINLAGFTDSDGARKKWSWRGDEGQYYSWVGAEMAWLRYLPGMLETSLGTDLLLEIGQTSRKYGVLIWPSAFRSRRVDALGERLLASYTSPIVYMPNGALRLAINFYGFVSLQYTQLMTYLTKLGPWSITKFDSIKQWPLQLRFGDYYWNGVSWQTERTTFIVDLDGDPENEKAEIMPSGRADDESAYVDAENGYIIPLRDINGDDLPMYGTVSLGIYGPTINKGWGTDDLPVFNPILLTDISLKVLRKSDTYAPYEEDNPDTERTYQVQTGYKGAEDVYEVEERLGTWDNDGCVMNVLIIDGAPLEALTSARQGGRTARPERLVLGVLQRLYGRARQQLSVEVEDAELWPSVTVMDGATRYALTGVHWNVREARATYVLEDYVPFEEWRAGR